MASSTSGGPSDLDLHQLLGHGSMAVAVAAICTCVFSIKPHTWGKEEEKSKAEKTSRKVHTCWYPQEIAIWKRPLLCNNKEKVLLQAAPSMLGYGCLRS